MVHGDVDPASALVTPDRSSMAIRGMYRKLGCSRLNSVYTANMVIPLLGMGVHCSFRTTVNTSGLERTRFSRDALASANSDISDEIWCTRKQRCSGDQDLRARLRNP